MQKYERERVTRPFVCTLHRDAQTKITIIARTQFLAPDASALQALFKPRTEVTL